MSRARVVVAGGGPVGLAFACAVSGLDVTVVEAATTPEALPAEDYDVRVFAVSPGTRALLRDVGAWEHLDGQRVTAVRRMEIFGDGNARLAFSARPASALAWIVEAGRLGAALRTQARSLPHVTLASGAEAISFKAAAERVTVDLANGERLEGDLLVGADGPHSRVRSAAAIPFDERPYGETAVVANFDCEQAHGGTARQWFRSDGVLAWLPLPGRRISIVWSTPAANAEVMACLDAEDFAKRVRDAGSAALGDLRLISSLARFPLRLIDVPNPVAQGVALIGDAAHAVHPLAGQGVNLGFQDVQALVEALAERSPLERVGDLRLLRRYARQRREDVTAMQFVTDRLDRIFASGKPGAYSMRNLGLALVDRQPWAKAALARRAMR